MHLGSGRQGFLSQVPTSTPLADSRAYLLPGLIEIHTPTFAA
jgi:alpha-D-ribose 1-methylphosphonate 5-triphosphate diphosphatase PhnM